MAGKPGGMGARMVFGLDMAGHGDDRQRGPAECRFAFAQAPQDLESIDLRHAQVDQHQIEATRHGGGDRLLGIVGFFGLMIERAGKFGQDEPRNHVIVQHKHIQRSMG